MSEKHPEGLVPAGKGELMIEEFSIVELEDRLEFLDRCNTNCGCPKQLDPGSGT
jgi:hypothetical protein